MSAEMKIEEPGGGISPEQRTLAAWQHPAEAPLQPDEFYFDRNNLMVFTATYLLRRGYCCGNGCRHCPYPKR